MSGPTAAGSAPPSAGSNSTPGPSTRCAAKHPADLLGDVLLVYTPKTATVSAEKRQSAAASLGQVLALAGLGGRPGLRPASFTEYAARIVFDRTGRIEAVAAALGMASLDATADLLAHDWRAASAVAGPPGVPDPVMPVSYAGVPVTPARPAGPR